MGRKKRTPVSKECKKCGAMFISRYTHSVYCSKNCRYSSHLERQRTIKKDITCVSCGLIFTPAKKTQITCSKPECKKTRDKLSWAKRIEKKEVRVTKEKPIERPEWVINCDISVRREVELLYIDGQIDNAQQVAKMTSYDEYMDWWRAQQRGIGLPTKSSILGTRILV